MGLVLQPLVLATTELGYGWCGDFIEADHRYSVTGPRRHTKSHSGFEKPYMAAEDGEARTERGLEAIDQAARGLARN